ncbi:MAG: FAD-binding protein, partial [Eggerthella sp.]|nr:FAD-binding protein [Eggerthella sp.]
ARYNELCDKGVDEDFYKNPDFLVKIDEAGPFYAAQNYAMFMTVMGGLRTSKDMEVCDENDQPIPGLFNVGAMVGDMYANTYNFAIPGNSYGINCLTFGYLLGRDLAAGKFA